MYFPTYLESRDLTYLRDSHPSAPAWQQLASH